MNTANWIAIYSVYIAIFAVSCLGIFFRLSRKTKIVFHVTTRAILKMKNASNKMEELEAKLKEELGNKKLNSCLYYALTTINYVIGIIFSSSFVQKTFDSSICGWAGIAILAAGVLNQTLKPDKEKERAARRIAVINRARRRCEEIAYNAGLKSDIARAENEIMKITNDCLSVLDEEYGS